MKSSGSKYKAGIFYWSLIFFICIGATLAPFDLVVAEKITIEYLTFINPKDKGPRQAGLREAIADFEAKYPDIKVNVRVVPWAEIPKIIIMETTAGKGPDAARIARETLPQLSAAGSLVPLDDYIKNWTSERQNDFIGPWEWTVFEGKKMALSLEHRVQVLYYRKDMLEEAGLKVPKSWDDLGQACKVLTKGKVAGLIAGLARKDQASNLMQWLTPYMWSAGGELYDEKGKGTFNNEVGYKVFRFLYDLVYKYNMPLEALNMSVEDITLGLRASTIAMCNQGTHRVGTARLGKGVGMNLLTSYLPGIDGKPAPAMVTGWTLAICKNSAHKDAAWKWIDHRLSAEAQLKYAKTGGELPAVASVYNDLWFTTTTEGSEMKFWADYIKNFFRIYTEPLHYLELADILAVSVARIIADREPIEKVLKEAEEKYNSLAGFK